MESYRKRIGEMIVKIIKKEGEAFIKIINDIKDAIIKIITGNDVDMVNDEVLGNIFEDLWKKMLDALSKSGKFGNIVAKLMESYRKRIKEMLMKIIKTEGEGLIEIIDHIKDDIIKIISGGHIDALNDEEMTSKNPFEDMWKRILSFLRNRGKFGKIVATLMDQYKEKIKDMLGKVLKEEGKAIIKIITDLRDDLIKIIHGGHIENGSIADKLKELWEKLLMYLRSSGTFGTVVADLMEKYKTRIVEMFKKVLVEEAQSLIKLIDDIKDDLIKIIKGGHIDILMSQTAIRRML